MRKLLFSLLLFSSLAADPWGKDAELVKGCKIKQEECRSSSPFVWIAEAGYWFHHNVISEVDGPRSNYYPSSSLYMLQAIRKYGLLRGVPLGCDRLMRENPDPWVYPRVTNHRGDHVKLDPVP